LSPDTAFQNHPPLNFPFPNLLRSILQSSYQLPQPPLQLNVPNAAAHTALSALPWSELAQILQPSCPPAPSPVVAKPDPMKTWTPTPQASEQLVPDSQISPAAPETPLPHGCPQGNSWSVRLCHSTFFGQCPHHKSNKYRRCEVCPGAPVTECASPSVAVSSHRMFLGCSVSYCEGLCGNRNDALSVFL
jgi:hypothetical protein